MVFLFAHGAGAPSSHPWMQGWQARLAKLGHVHAFDYPYMREGRRAPDRLPKLIEAHRAELATLRRLEPPLVLTGKSMGGRVGCHVALEEPVDGLICFGYPLKGAGKKAAIRDEVLLALETPILFVQGSRDPLCPLELLDAVRPRMKARSVLHLVEGGNHSLEVGKRALAAAGETREDVDARIADAVRAFVETL